MSAEALDPQGQNIGPKLVITNCRVGERIIVDQDDEKTGIYKKMHKYCAIKLCDHCSNFERQEA